MVRHDDLSPAEIATRLAGWQQGDYFELDTLVYMASPNARSTNAEMLHEMVGAGIATVLDRGESGLVAVITQTCDLVPRPGRQPGLLALSPLVQITDDDVHRQALKGERPQYARVPGAGEGFFADLSRIVTMEAGLLAQCEPQRGLATDPDQRKFARSVARRFSRFPFPDDLTHSLQFLVDRIKRRHGHPQSPEGVLFDQLKQVRVRPQPNWGADEIDVTVIFILPAEYLPPIDGVIDPDTLAWGRTRNTVEVAERLAGEATPEIVAALWQCLIEGWTDGCTPAAALDAMTASTNLTPSQAKPIPGRHSQSSAVTGMTSLPGTSVMRCHTWSWPVPACFRVDRGQIGAKPPATSPVGAARQCNVKPPGPLVGLQHGSAVRYSAVRVQDGWVSWSTCCRDVLGRRPSERGSQC
jgi:hypothetical protein